MKLYCHVGWFDCILSKINDDDDDNDDEIYLNLKDPYKKTHRSKIKNNWQTTETVRRFTDNRLLNVRHALSYV